MGSQSSGSTTATDTLPNHPTTRASTTGGPHSEVIAPSRRVEKKPLRSPRLSVQGPTKEHDAGPLFSKLSFLRESTFYLGLACLLTHELDAMPNHEWRVLPLLRALPDDVGMLVFVVGHVPLFAAVIALVASRKARIRSLSRVGLCAFLLVHGLGHALSAGDPNYEFSSTLSDLLIFGAAGFGGLYLLLEWRERAASAS